MKLDNIDQFIKDINSKDQQIIYNIRKKEILVIEERFKNRKQSSWEDFVSMIESDKDDCYEESKTDFTPINMLCKFIENDGDPLVYLKAISISYPKHPFCQMLIECNTVTQLLNKLKPLEYRIPIVFQNDGKKWLSALIEVKNLSSN